MMTIKAHIEWRGKTINIPNDIELRFNAEPRRMWIDTIPHSPLGDTFAYQASEDAKLKLISAYLFEKEYQQIREAELKITDNSMEPF